MPSRSRPRACRETPSPARCVTLVSFAVLGVLLSMPWPARAQSTAEALNTPQSRPAVRVFRVDLAPVVDGEVLEDPAFASAEPATGFLQNAPGDGVPVSERTEVRIVYTNDTLYFGVVCYDREPDAIIVSDSRRDADLVDTDSFQILLDTYLDGQNGFVFGTNPSGLEYDGQVVKGGEGGGFLSATRGGTGGSASGRQAASTGASFNLNWDGSWLVRTRVSEIGWTAEFAIPFRTLRYSDSDTWGLNFQRNIRRRQETAFWAPLPRGLSLQWVSMAGRMTGLQVPGQRNLKLTPYVLGEARHVSQPLDEDIFGDAGLDLKYSVTPSLTLDATYSTDFAQVEVDEEQVNLTRFKLFFPEKRPFFLENAGLFSVGNPSQTEVFFSRRIGISPEGVPIPILAGARLSGTIGRTSIGFLNMQTRELPGSTPADNFTVGRVLRELPNRSSVGVLVTSRHATGSLAGENDYGSSFAVDGRMGTGQYGKFVGFAARTQSPSLRGNKHAYDFGWIYEAPRLLVNLQYTEVGANFNPEVGFVDRVDFRRINGLYFRTIRMGPSSPLHEIRPHVRGYSFWDFDGFQETALLHIDSHWEWKNGHQFDTGVDITREGLQAPFEIFPGVIVPPGTYDDTRGNFVATTNQGRPLSFQMRTLVGGFYGGDRVSLSPTIQARVGEAFNTELAIQYNNVDLPFGSFDTNLIRARVAYSFSPRVFVQSLIQYNDRADLWSVNFRFTLLRQANTGLFVVYNDSRGLADVEIAGAGRSLIIKFSRLIDVL